jgi:hypothetical protein
MMLRIPDNAPLFPTFTSRLPILAPRLRYPRKFISMQMQVPLIILTALILAASRPASTALELTNTEGKTVEGELVTCTDAIASFSLKPDKRIVKIPLNTLNPDSLSAVQNWRVGEAVSKLKLHGVKNRLASDRQARASTSPGGIFSSATSSNSTDRVQTWQWTIKISNTTNIPLKGLKLKYAQVVERVQRGQGKKIVQTPHGNLDIPDIGPFQTVSLQSNGVEVRSHKSVSSSKSGSEIRYEVDKWDESLSGLGVEIFHGSTKRVKWKSGTDPGPVP